MLDISVLIADEYRIGIGEELRAALLEPFRTATPELRSGNAGSLRNLFQETYAAKAIRVHADGLVTDEELAAFSLEHLREAEGRQARRRPGFN